ncbi:DUF4838 domain-containing protein [Alistipes finegoldii]|uniref:DUF4838 domain-containing protein n=1 Tax=Alistipes finegoldii TaxID=214856 RepID=UPI0025AE173D|nr:DUF4838 domain-containing protein [Alistipes finegoldii]
MRLFRWIFVVSLLLVSSGVRAQTRLTRNGKPAARIVVAQQTAADLTAAQLLQRFVRESTGATLPLLHDVTPRKGNILIGASDTAGLAEDGFRLRTQDGVLRISSGGDKGAVYGVMTLLERYLGLDYFAAGVYDLDRNPTVTLPAMDFAENPAFRYRQSQGYGMAQDSVYRLALRLEEPRDIFAGGLWVHTFNSLLPASVYGAEHPEYYSFINGERRPGRASQWCLTNDELFELVAAKVDSIFRANPGMNIISISQNDSNFTYCRCEECEKVNRHEGAPSGNYVRFLNKLAERFPDKEFSTLAYLFTMQPPKHVKPLPNVNIMLCDIDCDREVPLTDNASGREFIEAMEGWAALSDNIFVWDYGINFDNYLSPFPNFHIIQPNIQLFRDHHANMVFEQIGGPEGCDMAELRAYLMSKLMWNPDLDLDATIRHFLDKYYGAAAGEMYRYLLLRQGGLLASNKDLWIYDSPVTHKDGMLNPNMLKEYNKLFDAAEKAVEGDSARLAHVQMARLTVMYSDLEISRANGGGDPEELRAKVEKFRELTGKYNVPSLNERTNSPSEYCDLYLSRFLPDENVVNKAKGAKVTYTKPPKQGYMKIADKALTDGIYGGTTYVESWVGWEGTDADFTIDLGSETEINEVTTDFLHQLGAWILEPKAVTWLVSDDNENFREIGRHEFVEDRDVAVKFNTVKTDLASPVKARYLRVKVDGIGLCPDWHYGVGHPAWFFIDEVTVK